MDDYAVCIAVPVDLLRWLIHRAEMAVDYPEGVPYTADDWDRIDEATALLPQEVAAR